jgi:hypothetical protein
MLLWGRKERRREERRKLEDQDMMRYHKKEWGWL